MEGSAFLPLAALVMLIFVNGWTDAPNAITCPVVTGCMTKRRATLLAGGFNLLGCALSTLLSGKVALVTFSAARFGNGAEALSAIGIGIGAVVLWAVAAWVFGIPTSESHGLIASVSGAAVGFAIKNLGTGSAFSVLDPLSWLFVAAGLLVSTLPAYALAGLVSAFAERAEGRLRRIGRASSCDGYYTVAQNVCAMATAFMHGAEDGQKFVGICFMILSAAGLGYRGYAPEVSVAVALIMTLGTLCGGGRIIERTGRDMVTLDKRGGACADLSASAVLLICVCIGLPVSTTHAKTCALMGAGKGVQRRVVCEMLLAWALTFPVCFLLGLFGTLLI